MAARRKREGLVIQLSAQLTDIALPQVEKGLTLCELFAAYLMTSNGRYLVQQFHGTYPEVAITEIKMLDLVLWQTR